MKLRSIILAAVAVASIPLFAACASAPAAPQTSQTTSQRAAGAPAGAPAAPAAAPAVPVADSSSSGSVAPSGDRMVIRTANLQVVVVDVNDVISKVGKLARDMGGYVVSSESQDRGTDRVGKVSVRVPSERMDDALTQIRSTVSRVDRETVANKDVTEEFVDQDARLRTLKATEEQYLQLMTTARTTDDIIKVQQSLQQVRQQIEQTQGRIQYLQRNTEMAVINVDLSTAAAARPLSNGSWNPADVANSAIQGLLGVLLVVAGLAIWIVVFAPVWVPLGLLVRWLRRRGRQTPSGPPAQPAEGAA